MNEFDENKMEDGKPFATNPPNDTTTNTPSQKQIDLSCVHRNEAKFCEGYGSDGENGPFVPERIMVKTVEKGNDIIPTLETPTAGSCFCLWQANSTTRSFIY